MGSSSPVAVLRDPLLANRYLFTGANPVNFVELDGHRFVFADGGGTDYGNDYIGSGQAAADLAAITGQNATRTLAASDAQLFEAPGSGAGASGVGQYDMALEFIYGEMMRNSRSWIVDVLSDFRNRSWWKQALWQAGRLSPGRGVAKNAARAAFFNKVRHNGDWDHKPDLRAMLGDANGYYTAIRGDSRYEMYYDIWSNIHFGFVGSAAHIDASVLQTGAALAGGRDDGADYISIGLGIQLWGKYGFDLKREQLHQAILDAIPQFLRAQQRDEKLNFLIPRQ